MPNESAPRVAVTDYIAQFGGPKRRAWHWRLHSRDSKPVLRAFTEAVRDSREQSSLRQKPMHRLVTSLWTVLYGWDVLPLTKLSLAPDRAGVVFSSSKGDLFWLEKERRLFPFGIEPRWSVPSLLWPCDHVACILAQCLRTMGAMECPVAACASGAHAIARGAQMLSWDQADWVLCGAVEASLTPLVMAGYRQIGALSKSKIMRPFDRRRDGFVPSEGIGALILESEEHAKARGAKVYGYVTGWDMGADATSMTGMCPSGDSIARAIERALKRAGNPQIDYINAHGTATQLNDEIESRGIKSVFGKSVPISSTKPLTGHLLGAAGAVEAVVCLQSLREQWAPPTLNLEEPDEACDLDYIPLTNDSCGRELPLKTVMSLNYGFGGHIGVLIFEAA